MMRKSLVDCYVLSLIVVVMATMLSRQGALGFHPCSSSSRVAIPFKNKAVHMTTNAPGFTSAIKAKREGLTTMSLSANENDAATTSETFLHDVVDITPSTNDEADSSFEKKSTSWSIMQQRIMRRLNTHEDRLGIHKISSVVWLLSLLLMLGTGLFNEFSEIPDFLAVPTWLFLASSAFQAVTGIQMAIQYREKGSTIQKGFISMSFTLLALAYTTVFVSPFATDVSNNFWIGNGLFMLTQLPLVVMGTDDVFNLASKMESRKLRNKELFPHEYEKVGDVLSYGLTAFVGFTGALIGLAVAADPTHDRMWLLQAATSVLGGKHALAENYFSTVLYNAGTGIGALAVTLRDKKLISKSMEQTMVAAFLVPGIYLNVHSLM